MGRPLHQITLEYSRTQDRLNLKISTRDDAEFRLWLTRVFVRGFWGILMKSFEHRPDVLAQPVREVKQAIVSMQHQQAILSGDFNKPHESKAELPLGEEPVLVSGVNCRLGDEGITHLNFQLADGRSVSFDLDDNLAHSLCHLLATVTRNAKWDLGLNMGDDASSQVPAARPVVH